MFTSNCNLFPHLTLQVKMKISIEILGDVWYNSRGTPKKRGCDEQPPMICGENGESYEKNSQSRPD